MCVVVWGDRFFFFFFFLGGGCYLFVVVAFLLLFFSQSKITYWTLALKAVRRCTDADYFSFFFFLLFFLSFFLNFFNSSFQHSMILLMADRNTLHPVHGCAADPSLVCLSLFTNGAATDRHTWSDREIPFA